jgi:predicted aspartyl protease
MNIIHIQLLAIEEDGFHIFVEAGINGKHARLLVDTGASRTVFDMERMRDFLPGSKDNFKKTEKLSVGLGTSTMESHLVALDEFRLGDTVFKDYPAVVLNMDHVNQSYRQLGELPIDGVLGGDLLRHLKAVIDYRKNQIRWRE